MILWTTQDKRVLKQIQSKGVYRARLDSILNKYDNCSEVFLNVYKWFSKEAEKVVPKPEGVEFPVWVAFEKEFSFGLTECQVRFELEVDSSNVITFDSGKWDYILNYWYIPKDKADETEYEKSFSLTE